MACRETFIKPRGSIYGHIYTTIMELGTERQSWLVWFLGPKSIMAMYMDPLGNFSYESQGDVTSTFTPRRPMSTMTAQTDAMLGCNHDPISQLKM